MNVNQATVDMVKEFEGFRAETYLCPAKILTIGYGTTATADVGIKPSLGMKITKDQAEKYLRAALEKFAASIEPHITAPINENEFGAFVSLAYNIGPGAFKKSTALSAFNAGDKEKAANAILLWDKAGGRVLSGLVRRREAERKLFLTPVSKTTTPRGSVRIFQEMMMTGEQIAGVVRAIVAALGGYFVGQGMIDAETATTLGGAVATLATAAWSIYSKRKS